MIEQHTHEWTETEPYACTQCGIPSPTCETCAGPLSGPDGGSRSWRTCDRCLDREEGVLHSIAIAIEQWTYPPRTVVRAYAPDLARAPSTDPDRLPFGLDVYVDDPALGVAGIRTPDGVEGVLWGWVALWSDASGSYENTAALDYLRTHLVWAANMPSLSDWERYRAEVRQVLGAARAHGGEPATEPAGPHCFDCGGRLVREWRADGLGDEVRCQLCHRDYDDAHYRLAFRAKVEAEASDSALVTEREAAHIWPSLASGVLRKWVERGHLTPAQTGNPRRYRLGDVRALVLDNTRAG